MDKGTDDWDQEVATFLARWEALEAEEASPPQVVADRNARWIDLCDTDDDDDVNYGNIWDAERDLEGVFGEFALEAPAQEEAKEEAKDEDAKLGDLFGDMGHHDLFDPEQELGEIIDAAVDPGRWLPRLRLWRLHDAIWGGLAFLIACAWIVVTTTSSATLRRSSAIPSMLLRIQDSGCPELGCGAQ